MNQKSRNALYAGLGTAFAVMLANPAIAYAGTWSNEGGPNQWKYYNDDNRCAADGWYWIDGDQDGLEECYYFDKNGFMLADTRTPDGFQVNSDGFWTVSGQVQKLYFDENACTLVQNLEGILSAQSFQIVVDRARCQVTVYAPDDGNGYIIPYRTFICSPGKENSQTPTGTFKTTRKYRWHALVESTYGQYCTRLGNTSILFHSVPGKTTSIHNITAEEYNKLGAPASHGCIRMTVADCKWIYDHCPSGTVVTVGDNLPAPFDRPETEKIPEGQDWDPTDPEIG